MRRLTKTLSAVMACVMLGALCLGALAPEAQAQQKRKSANTSNPRYAAIVIDADTGAVLYERYADKKLHPASLVKMMTLLMTFEALEQGTLTLNSRVRMSAHANSQPPSRVAIATGETMTVKDAIYALVTKSANNVATALGETIAGSESRFAAMMTRKARELGMTQTAFRNAHGLHHPEQVTSARDMARLSRHLVTAYPRQYKYFSTRNFSYRGNNYHNHNRLMESYGGMDGIKTGYINASGFNLAASAVRGEHRVIAVVFGGRTAQSRNAHVAELLDRGFAALKGGDVRVADASSSLTGDAPPLPGRKPARRDMLETQADTAYDATSDIAQAHHDDPIGEMIGEGDFDPAVARRFEAGMIAIAALKGDMIEPSSGPATAVQKTAPAKQATTPAAHHPARTAVETAQGAVAQDWAVQVGAFTNRARGDQALNEAMRKLPATLHASARPVIVPMKAGDGWVFRARIRGLSREQATSACRQFDNCMTISPRAF